MLTKFQSILQSLGYQGVFVLVDRVDEPYLINGSADLMRALIWPMLDNKLLKHPGVGIKLMLPSELKYFVEREGRDFAQRARLDLVGPSSNSLISGTVFYLHNVTPYAR